MSNAKFWISALLWSFLCRSNTRLFWVKKWQVHFVVFESCKLFVVNTCVGLVTSRTLISLAYREAFKLRSDENVSEIIESKIPVTNLTSPFGQ